MPSPRRYEVALLTILGEKETYTVTTRLHEQKAIAIAVRAHLVKHALEAHIYDVQVQDIGAAPHMDDGTVGMVPGDLGDRMEW